MRNKVNILMLILLYECVFSCKSILNNSNAELKKKFYTADSLYFAKDNEALSIYTYKNLIPFLKKTDQYRRTRILNYLVASKVSNHISTAKKYIIKHPTWVYKCDLDSVITKYMDPVSSCKTIFSEEDVLKINNIEYNDQYYRILSDKYENGTKAMSEIVIKIVETDEENRNGIKKILEKYSINRFTETDCSCILKTVFLVAQHSDNDLEFQRYILDYFRVLHVKAKLNPKYYAYLQDRYNINTNKKQIFGTQIRYNIKDKKPEMHPLQDSQNIDSLRFLYNLPVAKFYLHSFNNDK